MPTMQMDLERARIQADLQGLIEGDFLADELSLQMYSSDASIYQVKPLGVARPRHIEDVIACLKYANQNSLPIIARGSGSGVAGESIGEGLILDFSYYMRRILSIDESTVRLQPGVVLSQLNREIVSDGRIFGPDPATRSVSTMGGVMSVNASGSHWLQYGSARDKIESIQMVLGDGRVINAGQHNLNSFGQSTVEIEISRRVQHLLLRNADAIKAARKRAIYSSAGYHLHDVLNDGVLDLAKLIVGSEGTLGLITEMCVRTDPIPKHRGVVLFFFERMEQAAMAAIEVTKMNVCACDLMDRRLLSIARETDPRYNELIPSIAEAMLLVEISSDEISALQKRLTDIESRVLRRKKLAFHSTSTADTQQRNFYWKLARRVTPRLQRLSGSQRPTPFIEDIVVPPDQLPEFLKKTQKIFQAHQVIASVFCHAGHGVVHLRPFIDLSAQSDLRKMKGLADEVYDIVLECDGQAGGEHGDGLSRTWFLRKQFPELYPVFRDLKRIFDPQGLLNPGKIVSENIRPLTKSVRPVKLFDIDDFRETVEDEHKIRELPEPSLNWENDEIAWEARNCNGCGRCRASTPGERMCPMFRLLPAEEASPRSKANILRAVMTGEIDSSYLEHDRFKEIAELCFNCHQCKLECPASVDIPKLMVEAKSQFVEANGLRATDWLATRVDWLAKLSSRFHFISTWLIGNRTFRWLLDRTVGIAQRRKLPRPAKKPFYRVASRLRLNRPSKSAGKKVIYYLDTYANFFDTQLANAFVKVLQHNGVQVYVPDSQQPSGMPYISMGVLKPARRIAQRNIDFLVDAVRQGYHVVTTEPTTALCLKTAYKDLLDHEDVRLVAENTSEACHYLWRMHEQGELELDFRPVNATAGYHLPCHQRALENQSPGEKLLRLIPGLTVERIEKGCSGMAGIYGLTSKNYRNSLRIGMGLINAVRDPRITVGTTECSACKMQMEQGTTKSTIHPIKLLALAYSLAPEVEELFEANNQDLFLS